MKTLKLLRLVALTMALAGPARADSFFMYQGRLKIGGGQPDPSDLFDVQFRWFDVPSGGVLVTQTLTQVSVLDSNGLFRALIDLGPNAFTSDPRWMELAVRRAGTPDPFATLSPRQRVSPVPTSLHAQSADVAASVTGVLSPANLPPSVARLDAPQIFTAPPAFNPPSGPPFTVGITQKVANLNADLLDGLDSASFWRRNTNGGVSRLTEPADLPVEIRVQNTPILRLQKGDSNLGWSLIGGSANNNIATGVPGSVIGGGRGNLIESNADYSVVAGGDYNQIGVAARGSAIGGGSRQLIGPNSVYAGVFAGYNNVVSSNSRFAGVLLGNNGKVRENSDFAAVFSGDDNSVGPNAGYATIVSGGANRIESGGDMAFIGAGQGNIIRSNSPGAAILSGQVNRVGPGAQYSVLAGGGQNEIGPASYDAFLGGGQYNKIEFNAPFSAILGGNLNLVRSNAGWSAVLGGVGSVAGAPFAIAAGHNAKAEHSGSIVLADGQYLDFVSSNANEFAVRAGGGVRFVTGGIGLTVDGMRLTSGGGGLVLPAGSVASSNLADGAVIGAKIADGNVVRGLNGLKDSVTLSAGDGLLLTPVGNELRLAASRTCSDYTNCYWSLLGNGNVTAGVNYLGTVAGELDPLEFRVNNNRALLVVPAATPNLVGGFVGNSISGGVTGTHIGGGGEPGSINAVGANYGAIGGGSGQAISPASHYATIGGGNKNTVQTNSPQTVIGGGENNTIAPNSPYGTIGGGQRNSINQDLAFGTIPGGQQGRVFNQGQMAYASGAFASVGDAQFSLYVLRRTLTTAATNELFLDGDAATQRMKIPVEGTWTFDILVSARTDAGASAGYRITGVIRNNAGATSFTGVPAVTVLAEDIGAWNVWVEADNVNDALVIKASAVGTPTAATRWVATVRTTEVVF